MGRVSARKSAVTVLKVARILAGAFRPVSTASSGRFDKLHNLEVVALPAALSCRIGGRCFFARRLLQRLGVPPDDLGAPIFE